MKRGRPKKPYYSVYTGKGGQTSGYEVRKAGKVIADDMPGWVASQLARLLNQETEQFNMLMKIIN